MLELCALFELSGTQSQPYNRLVFGCVCVNILQKTTETTKIKENIRVYFFPQKIDTHAD